MLKRLITLSVIILTQIVTSCNDSSNITIRQKGEIVVAMDTDMPGFFTLSGESYGYQYDLLKAYSDHIGVPLRVVSESNPANYRTMLEKGEIDIMATLATHTTDQDQNNVVPVYSTSYVILSRKGADASRIERMGLSEALSGKRLVISSAFRGTKSYQALILSATNSHMTTSSRDSFDLIGELSSSGFDYLVCEKSEAQLGVALVRNITEVFNIKEQVQVNLLTSASDKGLKEDFVQWLEKYRRGSEYAMLNELYFEKGFVGQYIGRNLKKPTKDGGISTFDKVMQRISKEEGFDWRLLSAIAYQESKFNQYIVSPRGARGLMQVMPAVARQFDIEVHEMMNPEINVMLAAKHLNVIQKSLRLPTSIDIRDRWSIILACYNGGIGHVLDARNLARKYGEEPNSWSVVAKYLQLKADPKYANDEVVRSGRFKGTETLAFVSSVLNRYDKYCNVIN